ncbi:MAG: tetratricopeptide repeat protein [Magnetococcales bacterium]|nr:tetratricopeptide repeat protein [Magnetococcales bacterium]
MKNKNLHRTGARQTSQAQLIEASRCLERGDLAGAEQGYRRVLALAPGEADAWHLLGVTLHKKGDHQGALTAIQAAIARRPDPAFYHLNLGRVLLALGRPQEAGDALDLALKKDPRLVEAWSGLARAALALGDPQRAITLCQEALRLAPDDAIVLNQLAIACRHAGQTSDAEAALRTTLRLHPGHGEAMNNLGNVLRDQGRLDEALVWLTNAIRLQPGVAQTHANLGHLELDRRHYEAAAAAYGRAAVLDPDNTEWPLRRVTALIAAGDGPRALAASEALLAKTQDPVAVSQHLFVRANLEDHPEKRAAAHCAIGDSPPRTAPLPTGMPLRVGYLSADFRDHSVFTFFQGVLRHHDPAVCEVFLYANLPAGDTVTAALQSLPNWRAVHGLDDRELALLIRRDNIHILVDLAGHTTGNRLGVFAHRPAFVGVSFLGYPATTGMPGVDWRITDRFLDPPDEDRASWYTERLARLPDAFFCYTPPETAPEVAPPPLAKRGHPTFGVFCRLIKITPEALDDWCAVLRRIPEARLLLQAPGLGEATTRSRMSAAFARRGIPASRLELLDQTPFQDHLALHAQVDILLDTWPWNGHTTTCNSLWMGVATLTRTGQNAASRLGLTILANLGLAHAWTATHPEELVAKAVALTCDGDALATLRAGMRRRMLDSPLCDAARYTRHLEALYLACVEK